MQTWLMDSEAQGEKFVLFRWLSVQTTTKSLMLIYF